MSDTRSEAPAAWVGERILIPSIVLAAVIGLWMGVVAPVDGDDACFHLRWIPEFYDLLRHGILFPRWLPDGFHGFGAPTFYFYPPLTYYLSSLVMWMSGEQSPEVVFNITALVTTIASGVSCYVLLRRLDTTKTFALLGALFYAFAPYRQFDLYTRSSLSQPMGFIFVPLVFAGMLDLIRSEATGWKRYVPSLLLVFNWAALLLCAFPIALVTGIITVVFGLAYSRFLSWSGVASVAISMAIGSGLAGYHYLPSYAFQQFVQTDWYLGFSDGNWIPALLHGTQLRFVIQDMLIYGSEIMLLVWLWRHRRDLPWAARSMIGVIAFFILISTPYLSAPLWQYFSIFHLIQFHSRFSILVVLLMSVLVFSPAVTTRIAITRPLAFVWIIVSIGLSLTVIFHVQAHPHGTSPWMDPPTFLPTTLPRASDATMDTIFIPHVRDAFVQADPLLRSDEWVQSGERTPIEESWKVQTAAVHQLIFHQFVWPQWKVYLDDNEIPVRADAIGRIVFSVPAGVHQVRMHLQTSKTEIAGFVVSGISLLLVILSALVKRSPSMVPSKRLK